MVGDIVSVVIYGHDKTARIVEIHDMGTVDVEVIEPGTAWHGKRYRVSGLAI